MRIRENIEWKIVEGTVDWFVSNYGDFKRLERDFIDKAGRHLHYDEHIFWSDELSRCGGSNGIDYLSININGHKQYAHRVVAQAFINNPLKKPEINHKDGNTYNNYVGCQEKQYTDSNLEWVTRKENMEHAVKMGLMNHESILRKYQCSKNREKIRYDEIEKSVYQLNLRGDIVDEYKSLTEASKQTGINARVISAVCKKQNYRKSAGGYIWVYADEYDSQTKYVYQNRQALSNARPIQQFTIEGELVREYASIQEACRINNWSGNSYISEVCKGKRGKYKNFIWKYKEN